MSTRRSKYLLFLALAIIGVACIIVATQAFSAKSQKIYYDILMGVGSGLVGTALTSGLILYSYVDEKDRKSVEIESLDGDFTRQFYLSKLCTEENPDYIVSPDIIYDKINQIVAISQLLEMLCGEQATMNVMNSMGIEAPVYGVVALFKGKKRRTIASYKSGKAEENHIHEKNDGAVGIMLDKNKDSNELNYCIIFVYYDGKNKDQTKLFLYHKNEREDGAIQCEYIEGESCSRDTYALLAVPIFSKKARGNIIGTLTLDFPKSNTAPNNQYLKELCEKSKQYANVICNIIGYYPEKDFNNLVFNKWGKNDKWK